MVRERLIKNTEVSGFWALVNNTTWSQTDFFKKSNIWVKSWYLTIIPVTRANFETSIWIFNLNFDTFLCI